MKCIDLTGQRFGRLVVIRREGTQYDPYNPYRSKPTWRCKCDCGNEHITTTGNLKQGYTRSCGCLRRDLLIARRKKGENICKEEKSTSQISE